MSQAQIRKQIMEAEEHTPEPPRPLRKTSAPPEPYPVEALGGILAGGATAIQEKIQAPLAICADPTAPLAICEAPTAPLAICEVPTAPAAI